MGEPVRVLVVDDNPDDRLFYGRTLRKIADAQYDIAEVEDGDQCLDQVGDLQPDCILLDYSLPGRNGVEVLKAAARAHALYRRCYAYRPGQRDDRGYRDARRRPELYLQVVDHRRRTPSRHPVGYRLLRQWSAGSISSASLLKPSHRALAHDLKEPMRTIKSYLGLLDWPGRRNGKGNRAISTA